VDVHVGAFEKIYGRISFFACDDVNLGLLLDIHLLLGLASLLLMMETMQSFLKFA
jgi:hypothetical protein